VLWLSPDDNFLFFAMALDKYLHRASATSSMHARLQTVFQVARDSNARMK